MRVPANSTRWTSLWAPNPFQLQPGRPKGCQCWWFLLMRDAVWQVPSRTFDVVPNFMEKTCVACAWGWGSFLDPWNSLNQTFHHLQSQLSRFFSNVSELKTRPKRGSVLIWPWRFRGKSDALFPIPSTGGPIFTTWRPPKSLGATWPWSPSFRWCRGSCALPQGPSFGQFFLEEVGIARWVDQELWYRKIASSTLW